MLHRCTQLETEVAANQKKSIELHDARHIKLWASKNTNEKGRTNKKWERFREYCFQEVSKLQKNDVTKGGYTNKRNGKYQDDGGRVPSRLGKVHPIEAEDFIAHPTKRRIFRFQPPMGAFRIQSLTPLTPPAGCHSYMGRQ
ncbi:hypothetical protein AVEN_159214-1 [Araneus ventricosus]|uniref:Uncharacterized protein n=1 Tax=Araneus ventricosus TaxID=182803 RepID=A0A4Y2A1G1_ARAVE|nr:hypothetical protein AVEN_159214-1 [Araneus ventricosus]